MTHTEHRPRRRQLLRVRGRSIAWLVPLLLLAGIVAADYHTTEQFRIVSWIVLVPGIAAAVCGVATTAGFAVLSLVTFVAEDHAWPHQYQVGSADFVLVALGGALAVCASVVRVNRERESLRMRDIAETTRRTVLRPLPPGWAGLEHAGVYLAADSEARVGGDFYDIQPGPHGTRVLVGDVQGKGLGAVATAAALLGTFREAGYHEADLRVVAERLEIRMARHRRHTEALGRPGDTEADRFATAVLIGFPQDGSGTVELIDFGHEPPLAVGPQGVRVLSGEVGLPLGLEELAPGRPQPRRVPLAAGETLLLVTDGVTEARDRAGRFYDLDASVTRALAADPATARPALLVLRVRDSVLRHCGGHLGDDLTVFAVRRLTGDSGDPAAPGDAGPPG
uniref:PP2C family protein-serine/threonine phosphatase n=1 Tax=Streptomyces corallincola TaxID=2851888 RepID=UPI001FE8FF27|nr:PP2C family protein-serine/threonine phosphatase [Streptomyces corallincola]